MRAAVLLMASLVAGCPNWVEVRRCNADADCVGEVCTDGVCQVECALLFRDADGDGFGAPATDARVCPGEPADRRVENDQDCDDSRDDVRPGAPEVAGSGVDEDCDGLERCFRDGDDDGFGAGPAEPSADLGCAATGLAPRDGDCADDDPTRSPALSELVADGVDQDCDGVDACFADVDDDGFGVGEQIVRGDDLDCADGPGTAANDEDCNDASERSFPGGAEETADGLDGDCDGFERCFVDGDDDGYGDAGELGDVAGLQCAVNGFAANGDDCDDTLAGVAPGAEETAADGVDQDCDAVDSCFADLDGDGFAGPALIDDTNLDCADDGPGFATWDDCADDHARTHPGGVEQIADGADGNCDGDELCFTDLDGDGFGDRQAPPVLIADSVDCIAAPGAADNDDDCDDTVVGGLGDACDDGVACTTGDLCARHGECVGFVGPTCAAELGCAASCSSCPAAGCCDQQCSGTSCPTCSGCDCRLRLSTGNGASADCVAGASCALEIDTSNGADLRCSEAACDITLDTTNGGTITCIDATCIVDVRTSNGGDLLCDGSYCTGIVDGFDEVRCEGGSRCDLTCAYAFGCDVACLAGSSCAFVCTEGPCRLACDGQGQSCGGGVTVCERPCP